MRKVSFGVMGSVLFLIAACGGSDGAPGAAGATGATGPAGPAGPGSNITPSAGAILPNIGLLGREGDIVVTGDVTTFDSSTTLDLGAGVTVSNLQVVSPTTIYAHVKIDPTATLGSRDVTITAGGTPLVAKGGYKISPTMDATISGTAQQGGLVSITLANNDTQNAFDSSSFALAAAPYLTVGGNGVDSNNAADYLVILDPLGTGSLQLQGNNFDAGGNPTLSWYSQPGALTIAARTPTALTVGTALTTDTFATSGATHLYKVTAPAGKTGEFSLNVTTGAADATVPFVVLYPSSGKSADVVNITAAQAAGNVSLPVGTILNAPAATSDFFLVMADEDGTAGNKYNVEPMFYDMGGAAYAEAGTGLNAHNTKGTAENITTACVTAGALKPSCVVTGTIAAGGDVDLYTVTTTAAVDLDVVFLGGAGTFDAGPVDPAQIAATTDTPDLSQPDIFGDGGVEAIYVGSLPGQSASSGQTTTPLKTWIIGVAGTAGGAMPTGKYTLSMRAIP